jgi:hypothetical protein
VSDLQRTRRDVLQAAMVASVALANSRKEPFGALSTSPFELLTRGREDPRRAFYWHETPPELASAMCDAIEAWLDEHDPDRQLEGGDRR